ncbi:hypothetical protein [Nostoc sp. C057]|uniref:hypothetical protein n=1 Tax=Nostoc sp. C057 TaxID=2576903 RepID=UPI002117D5A3|nr:hypothetical protein [Nostoc sp. C057]
MTIRSSITQSLIGLALFSTKAVFTQTATAETIIGQSGNVRAEISYEKPGDDGKGFLAAYLADKYLLNQGQDGWQRVQQAYKKSDRTKFFADLRKFLRETGYIK